MKIFSDFPEFPGIRELCTNAGVRVFLASTPETVCFLTGIEFPFASHFPDRPLYVLVEADGHAVLICPYEWGKAAVAQGWAYELAVYPDQTSDPVRFAAEHIRIFLNRRPGENRGILVELNGLSATFPDILKEAIPGLEMTAVDDDIISLRMVKKEYALELLRTAAEQLDFGVIGSLQHLEGSIEEDVYTLKEFCERIRVHVYEAGGSSSGLSAVGAGKASSFYYGLPEGKFKAGELVRIESSSSFHGYQAVSSRMITIGAASELQVRAYEENMVLKGEALDKLRPGVTCSSIFSSVNSLADERGIDFRPEYGVGHGIGVSEVETPLLTPTEETRLLPGMCIVLAVYTEGPEKELICSKDTYMVGEREPVCISSYHNWDRLYEIDGFRSAH